MGKTKELIKSIVLVALVALSIVLVLMLWPRTGEGFELGDLFKFEKEEEQSYDITKILTAKNATYRKADGNIVVFKYPKEVFNDTQSFISTFLSTHETAATEISSDMYDEAKMDFESLRIKFSFIVPFDQYVSISKFVRESGYESVIDFDEILISKIYPNSIFFKNSKENKCYRIYAASEYENFDSIISSAVQSSRKYEDVSYLLGKGESASIPFANLELKYSFGSSSKMDSAKEEQLVRALFGETFDFARRAVDANGNITYMYGYGQKIVTLSKNGDVEYRAEALSGSSEGLLYDIGSASTFLENIGALDEDDRSYYVISYASRENTGKTNATKIIYEKVFDEKEILGDESITVEVENGEVISYTKENRLMTSYSSLSYVKEAASLLAEKSKEIYEICLGIRALSANDAYDFVCTKVEYVKEALFEKEEGAFYPCYIVCMQDGKEIIIDANSETILETR